MSEQLRNFVEAIYTFDAVVNRMPAGSWDAPSPCADWTARDVVGHQCAVLAGIAAMARSGEIVRPIPPDDLSDPVATWRATRDDVLAALDEPGVLQQKGPFWFDAADIDATIRIVTWDPLTHAWDLAQCAGLDPALNPSLVEKVMAAIEPMSPMLVKTSRTAAPVEVDGEASVVDRYLALVGRDPAYRPPA